MPEWVLDVELPLYADVEAENRIEMQSETRTQIVP